MKHKIVLFLTLFFSQTILHAQDGNPVPTREQYALALISALGSAGPRLRQAVGALAAYCGTEENFFIGLGGNCDRLYFEALQGNGEVVKRVLRTLRPREVVQQSRTATEIVSTQQANIASRMSQVRAGVTNSLAGLNISAGGKNIPLEMLGYLSEQNDPDSKDNIDQLFSPWGFFITGQITTGDYEYGDATDEGFDFDTQGITAGIDYRLNNKAVIGVAIGYSDFDSEVNTGDTVESKALTFSAYGSFNVTDNFYVDARASFGNPDFDQQRTVDFNLQSNQTNQTVFGETEGSQKSIIITSGYQFNKNGWQFTPSVSAEFYESDIDAFVETGSADFNVGFSEQNFKTTRFTAGFQANKAISLSKGVLIPSMGYTFVHENQNGDDVVLMRVSGMPAGEFFESETSFNDGDYGLLDIGLSFVASNGKQAFIQYSQALGWEGFDKHTLNLGARFEF
jgi:outer membrane lipase/esterase